MARKRPETRPTLLGLCRHDDGEYRVLLVSEIDGTRIVDRWSCTGSELGPRLTAAGCGQLLVILPATATLVRTVHVPPASPLQVESAIRIEAEAKLMGSAPPHRTATGLLGIESPHPTGLAVAWPEALTADLPPLPDEIEVGWVPEIACLAFLSGDESQHLIAQITGMAGSTAISAVIPSTDGPVFRSTRSDRLGLDPSDQLRPLVVETLLSDGIAPDRLEATLTDLLKDIDDRMISGGLVVDQPETDARLNRLATNIALESTGRWAATDRLLLAILGVREGGLAHLARLRRDERSIDPGVLGRSIEKLSHGRTAVGIVIAAILVFLLVPLASSGLRLAIMNLKVDDLAQLQRDVQQHENLKTVYRELDKQAWSMTKLLGDIANLTPEEIEITSISIAHGEPIAISGVAKRGNDIEGRDIVFEFTRRLRESKLFAETRPSIEEPDSRGYTEFSVSAELASPLLELRTKAQDDYAILTYRDRRYGPTDDDGYLIVDQELKDARLQALIDRGLMFDRPLDSVESEPDPDSIAASTTTTSRETGQSSAASTSRNTTSTEARTSDSETTSGAGSPNRRPREARDRPSSPSRGGEPASRGTIRDKVVEIPPPLSEGEVATLSNAEAKATLEKVASARKQPGLDDEVEERLKREFYLLMARIQETNKP